MLGVALDLVAISYSFRLLQQKSIHLGVEPTKLPPKYAHGHNAFIIYYINIHLLKKEAQTELSHPLQYVYSQLLQITALLR